VSLKVITQITFRGLPHSDAVEEKIREKSSKLEKHYRYIQRCIVVIESLHHRHHQGVEYGVNIEIVVPDKGVIVNQSKHSSHTHEDLYVSIRDAFDAAKRQLEDYASIRRGETKSHQVTSRGSREKRKINGDANTDAY
jgi:ribosome-associated translation inhibitor RaiA